MTEGDQQVPQVPVAASTDAAAITPETPGQDTTVESKSPKKTLVEPEPEHELVALPSSFDPEAIAELPRPNYDDYEGDELRVPNVIEKEEEEEDDDDPTAGAKEEEDQLRLYLQDLQGHDEDGVDGEEEEHDTNMETEAEAADESRETVVKAQTPVPESGNSTPLSEPPELPTGEFSETTEIVAVPPPPPPRSRDPRPPQPQPQPHAESSRSAAQRATLTPRTKVNPPEELEKNIIIGKRARKQRQILEFDDPEDLSEGDRAGQGRVVKAKPGGGGKPRARKKADGSFTGHTAGPGQPSKGSQRPKVMTEAQLRTLLKGKTRETQIGPCLRPRYKGWGKCCQCVGKVAGDSCRFREFRVFSIDPDSGDILDTADFQDTQLKEEMTALPRDFNTVWQESHILRTERTVAPVLLPVISRELRHIINNKAVTREVDVAKHRSVCDFCSSTIFGGYFFCRKCGRDYCLQCERYFSDSLEGMRESPWDLPDAARPRLLRCTLAPPEKGSLAISTSDDRSEVKHEPRPQSRIGSPLSTVRELGAMESRPTESAGPPDVVGPDTSLPGDHALDEAAASRAKPLEGTHDDVMTQRVHSVGQRGALEPVATLAEVAAQDRQMSTLDNAIERPDRPSPGDAATLGQVKEMTEPRSPPDGTDPSEGKSPSALEPSPTPTRSAPRRQTVKPVANRASKVMHVRPDLVPVTRFHRQDLEAHWTKLVSFVLDGGELSSDDRAKWLNLEDEDELRIKVDQYIDKHVPKAVDETSNGHDDEEEVMKKYYTKSTTGDTRMKVTAIPDPAGLEDKSHAFMMVSADELDNTLFDRLWAKGEPMVVDRVGHRFKQSWTPDAFIERFGQEQCHVIDCQAEKIRATTVGQFFETFKNPELRQTKGIWKLKDWPSTHDFQSAYPDLYNDFCDSLPVPDFTRREGVLNLYAHFPVGPTKPDIGPKMYNAFEAQQTPGGQGSTRLHMDVADAINIMLHASDRDDGQTGCAVWDLFRAEDADKIRLFLKDRFGGTVHFADPIHSQMFYLDSELRKALADEYGVVSFRVYQYPGQAVLIPAGCAHQVCNLADCIKIALDFVSPHNVSRCQQLMLDFRKENYVKAWKDDVLQLYNVMWFSWLNAQETRQRRLVESESAERDRLLALSNGNHDAVAGGHSSTSGVRTLTTQISSVRDEPTPTPQTQSPAQSKESTPVPTPTLTLDTKAREEDRISLSKLLFEAMLKKNDMAPPPPTTMNGQDGVKPAAAAAITRHATEAEEYRIKTSDFVKQGLIPIEVAFQAMQQDMRNERKALVDEREGQEGQGDVDVPMEFSLSNLSP